MMMREIIPLSVPALINLVEYPVLGLFEYEVKTHHIRAARVILMDIHWYLTLPGAISLARRLKQTNPDVTLIAGGLTASTFAGQITRDTDIDYVLRGDAEVSLPLLIRAIMEQQDVHQVPNLVHRDFHTAWTAVTNRELFDRLEYQNWDFFPTLKKRVHELHRHSGKRIFPLQPYSMAFKGCPLPCEYCAGSPKNQKAMFKRPPVIRSAWRVREELEKLSADKNISGVSMFWDVAGLLPAAYTREAYGGKYDLKVYYELAAVPREDTLDTLLGAFKGGILAFSIDKFHTTSFELRDTDELIRQIKHVEKDDRYETRLEYSRKYCNESPEYAAAVDKVVRSTRIVPLDASFWWNPVPEPQLNGNGSDESYKIFAGNKGRKFFIMNAIYKTGIFVHRYLPAVTEWFARRLYKFGSFSRAAGHNETLATGSGQKAS